MNVDIKNNDFELLSDKEKNPLVSAVIITYNSANFIIETLESVKLQSYQNLELIISDDASKDDTVKICEKWISENQGRFVNVKIIKVPDNLGIAQNCNRGINAALGKWLKLCAGDDLLLPDCISENINFITNNKDAKIVISDSISFLDETEPKEIIEITKPYWGKRSFPKTAKQQYEALLLSYCGNTTSLFVAREVYATIKLDESFPLLEDYPFLLNATKLGNFVYYLNKETVMFRQRKESVYAGDNDRLFKNYYKKSQKFDRIYRYPNLPRIVKYYEITNFYRLTILDALHFNKKTFIDKLFYNLTKYLNPFRYLISLDDFLYKLKK